MPLCIPLVSAGWSRPGRKVLEVTRGTPLLTPRQVAIGIDQVSV